MKDSSREKIREIFEGPGPFLLATHVQPDADGLSCVLAVHLFFKARGVESYPLIEDDPPEFLDFLHGFGDLLRPEALPRRPQECVALVFDLSEAQRLGGLAELVLAARERVILDHHAVSGQALSGLLLQDPRAPATAFLVYQILRDLGGLLPEVAENLYVGLYSDTGGFRFENTREEAFLAAADLVRAGARPAWVGERLLENYPPARFELLSRVLERREVFAGGRAVVSWLTLKDFEEVGARPGEAEDFATFLRSMRGVKVSALVKELKPGEIGVSLRSRGEVDVARIAASQGGGGHVRAAGFRQREKTLPEVLDLVRGLLSSVLEVRA
ncbi:DHH family phosphoesterase [Thermosulfurimonas marina]|uniref:DHH family phosphoesterase n=1 Tax=Thermosulfurimonas marina TaxID=2047767 RepID=UPI00144A7461|nr:bifunctional oligoribonuclease/PAP phosphatase NrnA [Thermosulfurimonas marina]